MKLMIAQEENSELSPKVTVVHPLDTMNVKCSSQIKPVVVWTKVVDRQTDTAIHRGASMAKMTITFATQCGAYICEVNSYLNNMMAGTQDEETTYIVFGGVPPLLHVHNINIKDCSELHLHKPRRICTKKNSKCYKRRCSPMKTIQGIKNHKGISFRGLSGEKSKVGRSRWGGARKKKPLRAQALGASKK